MFPWNRTSNASASGKKSILPWHNRSSSSSSSADKDGFDDNNGVAPRETRRISIPASRRLTAITEDSNVSSTPGPQVPQRNPARSGAPAASAAGATSAAAAFPSTPPSAGTPTRWSGRRISRFSENTDFERSAPPSYEWVHNPSEDDILNPADDEKLAELRAGNANEKGRRGGWGRIAAAVILLLIIAIALGVGLGVGLTRKNNSNSNDSDGNGGPSSPAPSVVPTLPPTSESFPVGTFGIPTKLKSVQTDCVSTAATWSCYPQSAIGTNVTFNWIITNTSDVYARPDTKMTTSSSGVPANLTVSAEHQFLGITFSPQNLTYISTSDSNNDARLIFDFTMTKEVDTYADLMPGQTGKPEYKCYFASTVFMGTLYLSSDSGSGSGSTDSLSTWPYAVDISQSAAGGANVPDCYAATDPGTLVGTGNQPSSDTCICSYKNY